MTVAFTGVVLTGGASRRMGRDKALVAVDGTALATTAASALRSAGAAEVLAVGGDRHGLEALGSFDRCVPDDAPGEGPLGGILTALGVASHDLVVVLACDTPMVTSDCPQRLLAPFSQFPSPDSRHPDVAVGTVDGHRQPLTAAWRRSSRKVLADAFDAGERAPRVALESLRVIEVPLPAREVDDVDSPEDLARYHRSPDRGIR